MVEATEAAAHVAGAEAAETMVEATVAGVETARVEAVTAMEEEARAVLGAKVALVGAGAVETSFRSRCRNRM